MRGFGARGKGSGLSPGPLPHCPPLPPCPSSAQPAGTPTLLVARLLSLLPRALSSLSTGPLDFMMSGRLAGVPTAGLNNAGARPGASWKRPGGGSRFPWVEGRLSGWCEEKPGPGSGGECRRERGRSLLQEVGGGGREDVGEARRSDSQDLPCWECQPRIFCPPAPCCGAAPCPGDPPYPGICKDPEIQPPVEWGGGRVGI